MAVSALLPAAVQPLAGAILGVAGYVLMRDLPGGPGVVAALFLWTAFTLAQGERGFARWLPALPMLGTLLGFCTLLLRWYALISLSHRPLAILAAMTLGPSASVALAWVSPPADEAAFRRSARLSTPAALIAIAEGVLASLACGLRLGSILIALSYLLVRMASASLQRSVGGVRGSDRESFRITVETMALALTSL